MVQKVRSIARSIYVSNQHISSNVYLDDRSMIKPCLVVRLKALLENTKKCTLPENVVSSNIFPVFYALVYKNKIQILKKSKRNSPKCFTMSNHFKLQFRSEIYNPEVIKINLVMHNVNTFSCVHITFGLCKQLQQRIFSVSTEAINAYGSCLFEKHPGDSPDAFLTKLSMHRWIKLAQFICKC